MKLKCGILILVLWLSTQNAYSQNVKQEELQFDFYGKSLELPFDGHLAADFNTIPTTESIKAFYNQLDAANYQPTINAMLAYKVEHQLDDWIYYQLVRRTAQQLSPKQDNYVRYTLYKWFLLNKSGYDATLVVVNNQLQFYVQSNDMIYDIPYYMHDGKQYVCLNIHDFAYAEPERKAFEPISISVPGATKAFSYRVKQVPEFTAADYEEKDIRFNYGSKEYRFKVKLTPQVQKIFNNYPVVDYESYFNIPLSSETYSSLIPTLKKDMKGMKQKQGIDFLMRFTRNAFLYEPDAQAFGKEKRLSPEQTLMYEYSDCDDRAALFFYLVKEIYDLPMIVLVYPTHVTIAVKFDKPGRNAIEYKGAMYSVCEPTPQAEDLAVGQVPSSLRKQSYEIAFAYEPPQKETKQ